MAVNLSPVGGVAAQFFDNSGNPLTGGKLYTYTAGTTTPAVTYTSSSGATAHPNPIVLDAAGRVPNSGEVWLTDGLQYKFVLKTSTDVLLATYDNIIGINSNFVNFTNEQEIQTATAGQTVFTLTTMQYQPGTNSLSVFVDGVNQYGPGAQYAFLETDSTTVTFISGLHVGAEVKFTTSAINASSYGDAFQISYTPPFTGSAATNVGDKLAQTVSVKDFGAVGDGIVDDTAAIQAAIDAACSLNETGLSAGSVYFPRGRYVVTSTLDCTNSRVNGTLKRDGLKLFGDGVSSAILGNCGDGNAVIETTGSQYLHIEDMCIDCNNILNPASIGILQALSSTLPQTQNQFFKCVYIYMPDMPTANANLGSICIYNFGAEENTYDTVSLYGNIAVVLTSLNNGSQVGPVTLTSYQTLDTVHSLGMTTFSGECLMIGLNKRKSPLIMQNITTPTFENTYISGTGSGGSDQYAMWFAGNVTNMKYHGVIEDRATILFDGGIFNSTLDITWGGVTAGSNPCLVVNRANANVIHNSTIKVDLQADVARPILSTKDGNESAASSYYISNSQFYGFTSSGPSTANLYIPLNVAKNAGSVNIETFGGATNPGQAAFSAYLNADVTNATGDGTTYSLNNYTYSATLNTGYFDAATGIFTAPQSGTYDFNALLRVANLASGHTSGVLSLVTTSKTITLWSGNPYAIADGTTAYLFGAAKVTLTAGDTAYLSIKISGSTKTVTTGNGATNFNSNFGACRIANC